MMTVESRRAAAPAVARRARMAGPARAALPFVAYYLAIWALAIFGLGLAIVYAPSLVPGLTPPAM